MGWNEVLLFFQAYKLTIILLHSVVAVANLEVSHILKSHDEKQAMPSKLGYFCSSREDNFLHFFWFFSRILSNLIIPRQISRGKNNKLLCTL